MLRYPEMIWLKDSHGFERKVDRIRYPRKSERASMGKIAKERSDLVIREVTKLSSVRYSVKL